MKFYEANFFSHAVFLWHLVNPKCDKSYMYVHWCMCVRVPVCLVTVSVYIWCLYRRACTLKLLNVYREFHFKIQTFHKRKHRAF